MLSSCPIVVIKNIQTPLPLMTCSSPCFKQYCTAPHVLHLYHLLPDFLWPTISERLVQVCFLAFLVFEFCVGIYFPSVGSLKSELVPDAWRQGVPEMDVL